MEDEDETLSSSEPSDSGDDFTCESEADLQYKSSTSDNDDENLNSEAETEARRSSGSSAPPNEDRKSQNVDALVRSEIHEKMNCNRCKLHEVMLDGQTKTNSTQSDQEDIGGFASISGCLRKLKSSEIQVGTPKEEDLANWGHHPSPTSVPDSIFQASAGDEVSFVFTNQVDGKLVPVESTVRPTTGEVGPKNQLNTKGHVLHKSTFSSQNQTALPSISSHGVSMSALTAPFKPLQRPQAKSMGPSEGVIHVALKPGLFPRNQLPKKRFSPYNDNDDDFSSI